MAFDFKNLWKGGALGKLGDAVVALQAAMEGVKAGNKIIVTKLADNSFKISYAGPEARNGWNGKVYKPGQAAPVVNVDVENPSSLLGEYICVNTTTFSYEWASADKNDPEWSCYKVAESWNGPVSGDMFGSYALAPDVNGAIYLGSAGGLPEATTENHLLVVRPNPNYPATSDKEFTWQENVLRALPDEEEE